MQGQLELIDGTTLLSGQTFSFAKPDATNVELDDIAIPLSNICRYAGQLPLGKWYSVAQHAVNASLIVPPEFAFEALLHDTAEAVTNDIVTPLKTALPIFKELEVRIESAMSKRFGFTYPMSPEVQLADRQMLGLEMRYIRGHDTSRHAILNGIEFDHLKPLVDLTSWTPRRAYYNFMERYKELTA